MFIDHKYEEYGPHYTKNEQDKQSLPQVNVHMDLWIKFLIVFPLLHNHLYEERNPIKRYTMTNKPPKIEYPNLASDRALE